MDQDRAEQRQIIRGWIDTGESRMRTVVRVAAEYELSHAEAQRLVQEVLSEVVSAVGSIDRQEFLAQQLTRLEALAVKAQDEGNLNVALGAYKEIHALAGLHGGSKSF